MKSKLKNVQSRVKGKPLNTETETGHNKLEVAKINKLIETRLKEKDITAFDRNMLIFLKNRTAKVLTAKRRSNEDAVVLPALLLILLDIPTIIHCKSSVDRTAQVISIYSSIKQWLEIESKKNEDNFQSKIESLKAEEKDFEKKMEQCLISMKTDALFRELFLANWVCGLETSAYSRLSSGFKSAESLTSLLPERFTRVKILNKKSESKLNEELTALQIIPEKSGAIAHAILFAEKPRKALKALGNRLKYLQKGEQEAMMKKLKRAKKSKKV